jgi:PAS domain S-box-containing protein
LNVLDETQLQVLLENMPNVAVEGYDLDGRVLFWNRAAEEVFGFSAREAVGRTLDELMLTPRAAGEFTTLLRLVQTSGQGLGPMEWDFQRPCGSIGTVLSTIVPFPRPDGTPRFLCIDVDVTERRTTEQALRESEERFRTLAEASLVGLWHITPAGHTIYINPALLRMLEIETAEGMVGHTYHKFFTDESLARIEVEMRQRAKGIASNYEVEMVGQHGGRRNVIISGAPLFGDDGKMHSVIGTFTDITERKEAERQLRRVLEEQRVTLNELDHRVRNNLAALLALINVSAHGAASVNEFAASIRGRVHAMSMVHNQLSHAKWTALAMQQIAAILVPDDLRHALSIDGPELVIVPRQCTPLAMVLQELVSNSMKHGAFSRRDGKVQLTWSIEPGEANGQQLVLKWIERGGPAVDAPGEDGTGLELVRGIVATDLRGTLELTFPREGATHTIRVPLEEPDGSL